MARSSLWLERDHGGPKVGATVALVFRKPDETQIRQSVEISPTMPTMGGEKPHPDGIHNEQVGEPTMAQMAAALRALADQVEKS